jgi:hypothetical protein
MEMKRKQTLKVEFKQFQRLPDWPIIVRSTDAARSLENSTVRKIGMIPLLLKEDRFGTRSLAE